MPRLPPVPRRALLAAMAGALYGLLILPAPQSVLGVTLEGVTWFLLSLTLLFLIPLSFHVYSAWAILWIVYRSVLFVRAGDLGLLALDLALPLASLALLVTSGYLDEARTRRAAQRA